MTTEVRQRKKEKSDEKPEKSKEIQKEEKPPTPVSKSTPKWTYMISPILAIIITTSADTFLDNKVNLRF